MKESFGQWPYFDDAQISVAAEVLRSGRVNAWTGEQTASFEHEFAAWCGTSHAIAMANGSLALSSAYLSIGLGVGDELITTPRTFIATASSAVLLGATPVFADVDRDSGCITAQTIEPLITSRTKAISIVHLGGWPADMPAICDLAQSHGIAVVEDCAQAHGAQIKVDGAWRSVGSFGDVAAWSFCQDKILTTAGEGGMVTTSNKALWDRIWSIKDHGKSYQAVFERDHPLGFRWLHEGFGSNFRLTEFQSSIGRVQLSKLSEWHKTRQSHAQTLVNALRVLSVLRVPIVDDHQRHAWYKFHCYVIPNALASGWTRDRIISEICESGYPAFQGSCSEVYLEKCFQDLGLFPRDRLEVARELGESSLMFLVHPTITSQQMHDYCSVICDVLRRASR